MGLGRVVVVPVVSPVSASDLARLAGRIAKGDRGRVVVISAAGEHPGIAAVAAAEQVVDDAVAAVRATGVDAAGLVRTGQPIVDAVLGCMAEEQATLCVMGWQGASTQRNVFGELIDSIVGRSTIPLAVVRIGAAEPVRVVLPVSEDHLLPGGGRGLALAAELAGRLQPPAGDPVTILRTGSGGGPLPDAILALGDRVHHDRRRIDLAVGAVAGPTDLVVAPVAPTASGLRTATTHMAWAAPEAWLLVAIDVGPPPPADEAIAAAVADAGVVPAPADSSTVDEPQVIDVTVRVPLDDGDIGGLATALRRVGTVGAVEELAASASQRCWRVAVTVLAPSTNVAIGAVLTALHDSDALQGAEITYDVAPG